MYAERGYLCDSLIIGYEKQIENYKEGVSLKDKQILLSEKVIQSQSNEIKKKNNQIKWLKGGIVGLSAIAFFEFIIIVKK